MKISGANLLSKIPPFFNTMIGKIVMLVLFILLLIGVYRHFSNSNEVKITHFNTEFENNIDKGRLNILKDTLESYTANLVLDYSVNAKQHNENPNYTIQCVFQKYTQSARFLKDSIGLCYSVLIDGVKRDSIINTCYIKIDVGDFTSKRNPHNKEIEETAVGINYTKADTIIHDRYMKQMLRCEHYFYKKPIMLNIPNYQGGVNISNYQAIANLDIIKKNENLYKNPSVCCLIMDFSEIKAKQGEIKIDFQAPMYFATISPTPDEQTASTITYYTNEKLQQIYKNGIYVYAESLLTKKDFENRNFILATIIGFLFSMIVDILYRLSSNKNSKTKKQLE